MQKVVRLPNTSDRTTVRDSMVRRWATSCLLLLSGAFCAFALDAARLQVTSKTISGVFMVTQNNKYSFNASVAIEACEALRVNIATKDQVETALQNGLEMCKFGWVEEKIAVAPRIQPNPKCGQSKTGLVPWRADESKLFDVFCFNDTGTVTTQRAMTTSVTTKRQEESASSRHPVTPPPLITSVLTRRLPLPTSTISHHDLSPSTPPPLSKKAPAEHLPRSTSSSQVNDTTLHKTPVTTTTTTTHQTTTSTRSFHASTTTSTTSSTSSSTLSPPVQTAGLASSHSENPNLGVAPVALLVTLGLLFILLAVTAVYYKKKGRSLPFHRPEQEKGAVETEMFKHFRERDLKRHPSTGDGERSRKCSSDITLLMEQEAKAEIA